MDAANDAGLVGEDEPHDACEELLRYFAAQLGETSEACMELAEEMLHVCPHNEQLKLGLQKLIEAKDCFVRSRLSSI